MFFEMVVVMCHFRFHNRVLKVRGESSGCNPISMLLEQFAVVVPVSIVLVVVENGIILLRMVMDLEFSC